MSRLEIIPIEGMPEIRPGDRLAPVVVELGGRQPLADAHPEQDALDPTGLVVEGLAPRGR